MRCFTIILIIAQLLVCKAQNFSNEHFSFVAPNGWMVRNEIIEVPEGDVIAVMDTPQDGHQIGVIIRTHQIPDLKEFIRVNVDNKVDEELFKKENHYDSIDFKGVRVLRYNFMGRILNAGYGRGYMLATQCGDWTIGLMNIFIPLGDNKEIDLWESFQWKDHEMEDLSTKSEKWFITRIDEAQAKRDHEKSVWWSQQLLSYYPNSYKAYISMGMSYNALGKYDDAILAYDAAIMCGSDDDEVFGSLVYSNRALANMNKGDTVEVAKDIRTALDMDPSDFLARRLIIKSPTAVLKALILDVKESDYDKSALYVWNYRFADFYKQRECYVEAISYYKLCLQYEDTPYIHGLLVDCYEKIGDTKNANLHRSKIQ